MYAMTKSIPSGPREILTPYRPIPLEVPEGMKHNEFFNSTENLNDLAHNNGLLTNPENLLLYRKALGHSTAFDTSIIYNTSQVVLDPRAGRCAHPVAGQCHPCGTG